MGPYCPIYGVVLLVVNSFSYFNDLLLFIISFIIIGLTEYITSFFLEKIFNGRWWDYSNRKYNLNGRVCLFNLLIFSIGSFIVVRNFIPLLDNILKVENYFFIIGTFVLFIFFSIDLTISIMKHYKNSL